jgi:hypothetical protein
MNIDILKQKLRNNQFRLSQHAEVEKQHDKITYREIDEAFGKIELIEDYPNDPRGHSCLLLGFSLEGEPLHFVCGDLDKERILLITMYRPKLEEWIDFRKRR